MRPFRERNPIVVGLVSVVVLGVAMLFAFSLNSFTFLRGVYVIEADFADAAGLIPENEVRVAGLKVGKVREVELAPGGADGVRDRVRVSMEIASGVQLGDATEAEIKLETLLGSKFVALRPAGGEPYIDAGHRIPLDQTEIPFEIFQVTNRSVETVGEVDAEALNEALRELAELTTDPEGNFGRALEGLAEATDGLDERDAELEALLTDGAEVLEVLSSRSQELGAVLTSGAELLGELSARRDAVRRFVRGTDELSAELADLIADTRADLDPALRDLHEILEVVRADLEPLELAVEALGPSAKGFARAFTQGTWADVYLQTVLDLPVPPFPGFPLSSDPVTSIFAEATR